MSAVSPPTAVASSEHPVAAHGVAECAGHLIDRGCVGPAVVLVTSTMAFSGTLADIAGAFSKLLGAETVLGVAGSELMAGARRVAGGPGMAAMAIGVPGASVRRIDAHEDLDPLRGHNTLAILDPFSVRLPEDTREGDAPEGRESVSVPSAPVETLLASALVGAVAAGGNRLVLARGDDVHEYVDGALALDLPGDESSVLEAHGFAAFAQPLRVTAVSGGCITALDDLPAAELFESLVAAASEVLDSALELGLRVPGASLPRLVSRSSKGLLPSRPFAAGEMVEPVYRSPDSLAAELLALTREPPCPILAVLDAHAQATQLSAAGGSDRRVEALCEVACGDLLGLLGGGVRIRRGVGDARSAAAVSGLRLGR